MCVCVSICVCVSLCLYVCVYLCVCVCVCVHMLGERCWPGVWVRRTVCNISGERDRKGNLTYDDKTCAVSCLAGKVQTGSDIQSDPRNAG